jgi:hypothetical protein
VFNAVFVWCFVLEQSVGGIYSSAQRYLRYTAAAAMAGTTLGGANYALPFTAALALLAAVAVALSLISARTTLNHTSPIARSPRVSARTAGKV